MTVQKLVATHPHPTSADREALLRCIDDCFDCERHADHHERFRICAAACRRCEQSCNDLLATIATPERS